MKRIAIIAGAVIAAVLVGGVLLVLGMGQGRDVNEKSPGAKGVSLFDGLPAAKSPDTDGGTVNPAALAQARAMHRALPGNVFLPPLPDQADRIRMDKRNHLLNRLRGIHHRIEKAEASADERAEYYEFRVKYNRDKIAMLKYVAVRGKTPGLDANAMAPHITKMIEELEKEIKSFEKNIPPK